MDKSGKILFCVACVMAVVLYIYMMLDIQKRAKERETRHDEAMDLFTKEKEIYNLALNGIKSGELKVAVITSHGIKFEKEVKQKSKKKK